MDKRFSVHIPGCSVWAETNSPKVALRELRAARRICSSQHVAFDRRENEYVTDYDLDHRDWR